MSRFIFSHQSPEHLAITVSDAKFDAASAAAFKEELDANWKPEIRRVTIDFSEVQFIDSSGVGALLSVQKRMPAGSEPVTIQGAKPNVVSVIELLRLHRVFTIKP
ncbi:MAG: STAS domain-containing protein [Opitutales bacterium]